MIQYERCTADDVSTPASNVAAVVTYKARENRRHHISGVSFSYNKATASGELKIEDGAGNVIFNLSLFDKAAYVLYFEPSKFGSVNTDFIITLAAGGNGCTGKLNVLSHGVSA